MSQSREMLGSRLGFLLLSAGCAIGLGNVWRFPYITGAYGGAVFVGVYLLCLLAVLPVMIMEFAVGRASRSNMGRALKVLPPEGTRWHMFSKIPLWGSYLLSMFYTTVTGWMLAYCWHSFSGNLSGLDTAGVASFFGSTLASPFEQVLGMTIVVGVGCLVCAMGVQKGVERVVKVIMVGLLAILVLLVVRSLTLPGAGAGVSFYLAPDVEKMQSVGWYAVLNAAMTQAFFTLSVGIGNMTIFGSYQSKDRSLTGEALWIMSLDTFVAIMAGLIIFPACFAFSVAPNSGPGLIFITLPNIFNAMDGGILWGTLFFVFMSCAALSSHRRVREHHLLQRGCQRHAAPPGLRRSFRLPVAGLAALCAGLQPAGRLPAPGPRHLRAGSGRLPAQQQPAALRLPALPAFLQLAARLGLGQLRGRGQPGPGGALPALHEVLSALRPALHHPAGLRHGLRGQVRQIISGYLPSAPCRGIVQGPHAWAAIPKKEDP